MSKEPLFPFCCDSSFCNQIDELNHKFKLNVKYISENTKELKMPREGDLGIDVYASEDVVLQEGKFQYVHTGVAIGIPKGFALSVRDRSSLAKHFHTMAGVIDSSYTGEILIAVFPHSHGYKISKGDKIAQLIIEEDLNYKFEIRKVEELEKTDRGNSGFGSTGK